MDTKHRVKQNYKNIKKGEVIKLFGIDILGTRFELGPHWYQWNNIYISNFKHIPNFGAKLGMSHNIFDAIVRNKKVN